MNSRKQWWMRFEIKFYANNCINTLFLKTVYYLNHCI
jgi:hypothetical protein